MYRPLSPTGRSHIGRYGRRRVVVTPYEENVYLNNILERFRRDASRRRRENTEEVDRALPQPIEVDLIEFYCKDNAKAHHTENYDLLEGNDPTPILRRGEPFFLSIRFKRPINLQTDKVSLQFTFGPEHDIAKGTLIILLVTDSKVFTRDPSNWDICISRQEKAILTLQIQIPYSAGVGLWRLKIMTQVSRNEKILKHNCKKSIYILFNPWCKDDLVYLPDSKQRLEYVLNDTGKIYYGNYKQPKGRPWVFGQFGDDILPASVFIMEKSGLNVASRGNPIKVVRAISAMVNFNDDRGVIIGNWSGNYGDGVAPSSWTGSSSILQLYLSGGGHPVKYGQCWVFSGVCTTVCRALGIPCRSVTNFVSAHDTDDSLTVDKYFDAEGNDMIDYNKDSIWNFHVWNDCWMARPDLPSGYGGWQAIDATPQETSEGLYRAGPASLVAVRRGEINHSYDAPFVFAEVNADIVFWQIDDNSEIGWKKLKNNTYQVGKLIVTKRIGFDDDTGIRDMEDISSEYKSKEGTVEERMSVLNAARRGGLTHVYDMPPPGKEDVKFSLKDIGKVMIGSAFHIIVEVKNESDEVRNVTSVLSASTVHYTGITARKVKRARGSFTLKPRQREQLGISVTVDDYLDKLVDYSFLKIYAISTVRETHQIWADEDDFQVEKPSLNIEIEGATKLYRRFKIKISFKNPLNRSLEECILSLEGPGLSEPSTIFIPNVEAGSIMSYEGAFLPIKTGLRKITAVFTSRQLIEVTGSKQVVIED